MQAGRGQSQAGCFTVSSLAKLTDMDGKKKNLQQIAKKHISQNVKLNLKHPNYKTKDEEIHISSFQ